MHKKFLYAIYVIALLIILIFTIAGCNNGKKTIAGSLPDMGRYVEELLDMDGNVTGFYDSFRKDGDIVFYAMEGNSRISRNVYRDGSFVETKYPNLLNELAQNTDFILSISESPSGSVMALQLENGEYTLFMLTETDISPVEVDFRPAPFRVIALDDSFLLLYAFDRIIQYNYQCDILHEYEVQTGITGFSVHDGTLAALDVDSSEIFLFDLTTGHLIDTFLAVDLSDYSAWGDLVLSFDETGVIFAKPEGIFVYDENLEQIVDGGATTLAIPTVSIRGLINMGGDFYALFLNGSQTEFARYTYREDMPRNLSANLDIWSLYDNPTIRQAIGEFQRLNPDVGVNMRVAMDEGLGITQEDVIRALNTEILGGRGPDLIVLDGLPVGAFIKNGVLKDISDLINSHSINGVFMENLKNTYTNGNGGIFGVPTRFTLPVMIGNAEVLDQVNSLSDLALLVEERQSESRTFLHPPPHLHGEMLIGPDNMLMDYYGISISQIENADGTVNEEGLMSYLEDVLLIERVLKEYAPRGTRLGAAIVAEEILRMDPSLIAEGRVELGLQSQLQPMSAAYIICELYETEGVAVRPMYNENRYFPVGGIGILSTGDQHELAERFIETLLSGRVQEKSLGDGFPVNGNALESMLLSAIEHWIDNKNVNLTPDMGFIQLTASLTEPIFTDSVIKNAVENQLSVLQEGTLTPQEAARRVTDTTRLYLAE